MGLGLRSLALIIALYHAHSTLALETTVYVADSCHWEGLDQAVERFSRAIQFKTVSDSSSANHARDTRTFLELDAYLHEAYPLVFEKLEVEKVGVDSLSYLMTWPGRDTTLRPAMFVSHVDVVPVPEASEKDWTYPAFSGKVADGFIWGRGTMDVKVTVVSILEAATSLLSEGWSPERTLMFAFGHDEEVGGTLGAAKTAELLSSRGVELEVIWDEGGSIIVDGVKPFMSLPVALVATAEKGYETVKIHVSSKGGHSSMPPIDGSGVADIMGRIMTKLQVSPPAPKLVSPVSDMLKDLAKYAPGWLSVVLSSIGVVPGADMVVARIMASSSAEAAALTRTTAAATRVSAGVADNVLPQQGTISVNLRLLPGDTPEGALQYLRDIIGPKDMAHVTLDAGAPETTLPASKVTPSDGSHFKLLKQAIQAFWHYDGQPVPVLPFLLPGGTDSGSYAHINKGGTLRFVPRSMSEGDRQRPHGTNERTSVSDFNGALCTFKRGIMLFGDMPKTAGAAQGAHQAVQEDTTDEAGAGAGTVSGVSGVGDGMVAIGRHPGGDHRSQAGHGCGRGVGAGQASSNGRRVGGDWTTQAPVRHQTGQQIHLGARTRVTKQVPAVQS